MKKNGFTLVELLVAVTLGALIMLAVYMAMVMAQRTSAGVGRKVITQQDTRAILDLMASEIRMASFNPMTVPTTWTTIPAAVTGCANVTSVVGAVNATAVKKGILHADANNLFIAMDLGGPPNPSDPSKPILGTIGDADNEYIFYSYNAATDAITRSVSCGGNVAILGGTALGSNVQNQNAGIALFQYFDRTGALLPAPVNIPAIRRVKITIVAETAEVDLNTKQRRTMIYSTDVLVRNHAGFTPNI